MLAIKFMKTPKELLDDIAIDLYFKQVKEAIISGVWWVSESLAVRLASYAVQCEYGNHNPFKHVPGFLKYVNTTLSITLH